MRSVDAVLAVPTQLLQHPNSDSHCKSTQFTGMLLQRRLAPSPMASKHHLQRNKCASGRASRLTAHLVFPESPTTEGHLRGMGGHSKQHAFPSLSLLLLLRALGKQQEAQTTSLACQNHLKGKLPLSSPSPSPSIEFVTRPLPKGLKVVNNTI